MLLAPKTDNLLGQITSSAKFGFATIVMSKRLLVVVVDDCNSLCMEPVKPSFWSSCLPCHLVVVNTHDIQKAAGHAQQRFLQIGSCLGVAQEGVAGVRNHSLYCLGTVFDPIWARRRLSAPNPSGMGAMNEGDDALNILLANLLAVGEQHDTSCT